MHYIQSSPGVGVPVLVCAEQRMKRGSWRQVSKPLDGLMWSLLDSHHGEDDIALGNLGVT